MTIDIITSVAPTVRESRRKPDRDDQVGQTNNLDLRGYAFEKCSSVSHDQVRFLNLVDCDLTGATVPADRKLFGPLSARNVLFQGADLTGCTWLGYVGDDYSPASLAFYDDTTVFPAGFKPRSVWVKTPNIGVHSSGALVELVTMQQDLWKRSVVVEAALLLPGWAAGIGALGFAIALIVQSFVQ